MLGLFGLDEFLFAFNSIDGGLHFGTGSLELLAEFLLEAFAGLLLGLFFLAVGMSLDLSVVVDNWQIIAISVVAFTVLKAAGVYGVARLFRSSHREAVERTVLMTQGGEFAFVLYAAALSFGLISDEGSAMLTAIIIVSMLMTPLFVRLHDWLMPEVEVDASGVETPVDATGTALLIGFGRFGQIVSQPLLPGARASDEKIDRTVHEGASDLAYAVPNLRGVVPLASIRP